ncbi:fungal-specific transcription factor domain-containing protein [Trichoderma chlorosporum]
MLLYTRLAPPKVPKRRSRAGCNFCKEKKKKCDEIRPICSRCQDHGQSCVYEPIKPRQRRRQDSFDDASLREISTALENHTLSRFAQKQLTFGQWEAPLWCSDIGLDDHLVEDGHSQQQPASAVECSQDVLDEIFTAWAADTLDNDACLDVNGFGFVTANGPVKQQGEGDGDDDDDSQNVLPDETVASDTTSQDTALAVIGPVSAASPAIEVIIPAFAEFSDQTNRRALIDHFTNVLSHLIVLREDEGNPFQRLVLPLSQKSTAVSNAIFALASAHLEHRGVQNSERSVYFHNKAIHGLATLIAKGCDANRNELLAAIILLIYYEVLVQTGRSNIVDGHLKGAMAIMRSSQALTDPTAVFLERAFRFYDVITALSFDSTPILPAPDCEDFTLFPPVDCRGAAVPAGNVDTLLGMAASLWPIIYRLSTLGGLKRQLVAAEIRGDEAETAKLRMEFETTASAVEFALQEWVPSADESLPKDTDNPIMAGVSAKKKMQSILNSAMAYRHSGFVYLYRTIYGCSRNHAVVQRHTHISLTHCVGTVKNKGPMGALLWPLFVASCEAVDEADRELSRQAFAAVGQRQGMTNIERARCIVEEVWRRADGGEDGDDDITPIGEQQNDLWRRVSQDMGVTVVFG